MADPSTFSIVELTGEKRTLELRGRALPYAGFTLEGKQRAEFTWYPGNPTATVQMLGTEEAPSTINGMWKDRFIKTVDFFGTRAETPQAVALWKGQQVEDALALTRAVTQLRLAGQLLRVTWDEQVRDGILIRFKETWQRREDVTWEMEFQWTSRGEAKQPATFVVLPTVDALAEKLRAKVDVLLDAVEPVLEAQRFLLRNLEGFMVEVEASVVSVEDTVGKLADVATTPQQAAQRTLAAVESVKAGCGNIVALFDAQPTSEWEIPIPPVGTVEAQPATLGRILFVDQWARGVRKAARDLELVAAEETERLRSLLDLDDLLAAFIAREDADLRDVAVIYYGDQAEWRRLLKYNRLRSSKLIAGDLVLVPKLTTADSEA